jgi:hypothetical protein
MKKICALLVVCSLGAFMAGCDNKKAGTSGSTTTGASTTTTPADTSTTTTK